MPVWLSRFGWFLFIWAMSVGTMALAAVALRWWLR